jgi:hypothetical protein
MEAFNKLSGLREDARFIRKPFRLDEEKAKEFLETIDEMIKYIEKFIA